MPSPKKLAMARQWELLKLLPEHGSGKSTRQLASELAAMGFAISKRQVERDLGELSEQFGIHCNDASIPYGWRWMPGASTRLSGLTLADALSLTLMESTLQVLLPSSLMSPMSIRMAQARQKLDSLSDTQSAANWRNKVRTILPMLPMRAPQIADHALHAVQEALLNNRQIEVRYRGFQTEAAMAYRLHPLGLVLRGNTAYLIAMPEPDREIRVLAMHRLEAAVVTDQPALSPDGFNIDEYLGTGALHFGAGGMLKMEARIAPELAGTLQETPLSDDQVLQPMPESNEWKLQARVRDSWQLTWWILSQGDAITVNQPPDLRQRIQQNLADALRRYASPTSNLELS
ncbi:helix-turn-helix transcriptional regulator [Perlucidibaca piscinae]|uniref:helix-turn-helix transcriptional regulator n=1 Tax=Perlucidibaca piscinae TaxID=392589 RepID=UPI0003B6BC9B|nr:WYL domain-containing protein [Perlucidibaca piscinae]